jgi:hypothetical protein
MLAGYQSASTAEMPARYYVIVAKIPIRKSYGQKKTAPEGAAVA